MIARAGPIRRALARARADERGFTVVEGMVAGLLLVIGALGALQIFDSGTRNSYRAEESQVLNNLLQAELEEVKRLPYGEIALSQPPTTSVDGNDPRWRVQGGSYATGRDGSALKQLVVNGTIAPKDGSTVTGGAVAPGPEPFDIGDISGHIYRFVTWTTDPACPQCGPGFIKRVVVAARIDEAPISFDRRFQELHTDVADPEATPDDNPAPDEEDPGTATGAFWLTDTPCSSASRQPITNHHPAHNTRGRCGDGPTTGNQRGAPDLMYIEAPALEEGQDPGEQPLYDYATDSEPATGGDQDIGVLMPWASNDSCLLQPVLSTLNVKRLLEGLITILNLPALPGDLDGVLDLVTSDSNKHQRIHTWVSPEIQGTGGILLGRGTLELFTKTINGAVHPGEICVWMSVRQEVTIPAQLCVLVCIPLGSKTIEVDIPVVNVGLLSDGACRTGVGLNQTHFTLSKNPWPAQWTRLSVPMCFAAVSSAGAVVPLVLPPESRIVLSIMVKKGGTQPGQGLEFMYDAVGYESRLELETNKILAF